MFHIKEFDEDPALQQSKAGETHPGEDLLTVNTSIPRRQYKVDLTSDRPTVTAEQITEQTSWQAFSRAPKQVLIDLFLPLGFPHSVDPSYLPYQFYDSLQGLCSYLRGVVSTSAVLVSQAAQLCFGFPACETKRQTSILFKKAAAGVGDAEATAMGAAMTWALKDGMGMIGGLLFSYHASPFFDAYVLEFRLFADLINDVALTLDMMAPLIPSAWLLWLMSASTLSKTMCGMSAGATKSSITCHLALEGNMADLNAKEGTQETLVSLLGMMLGVQLAKQLESLQKAYQDEPFTLYGQLPAAWNISFELVVSWAIFLFLTWLHMWANYRGVKLLKLKSLNRERATAALNTLVTSMAGNYWEIPEAPPQVDMEKIDIPSPEDIEESMLRATATLLFPKQQSIALGMPLLDILKSSSDPLSLVQQFQQERYIVGISKSKVLSTLRTGADSSDEIKAFAHCMLLRRCLDLSKGSKGNFSSPEDIASLIRM